MNRTEYTSRHVRALRPASRRGWSGLRELGNTRSVAWILAGVALKVALQDSGLPWSGALGWALGTGCMAAAGSAGVRHARVRARQERLHRRAPQVVELDEAAAPTQAGLARIRRLNDAALVVLPVFYAGALGGAWFLYPAQSPDGPPRLLVLVGGVLGVVVIAAETHQAWDTRRALTATPVTDLARRQVTVVGHTARGEVVVADGPVPAAQILAATTAHPLDESTPFPALFRLAIGRRLGDLVPGDILVAHGTLAPGHAVAVGNAATSQWASAQPL